MNYRIMTEGNALNISLNGELTFQSGIHFRSIIDKCTTQQAKSVVIDLHGVEFIDSAGLGMLLVAHEHIRKQGGEISVRNPKGQVERMLDLARFKDFFPIQ